MALKPGTKAYEDWKKKNFNLKINVPESVIQKLRDGKTPSNNKKRFAGTKNVQIREAMNRFYGKGWDKGAKPSTGSKPSTGKPNPPATGGKPNAKYQERQERVFTRGNAGKAKPAVGKLVLTGSSPTMWQAQTLQYAKKKGVAYETPAEGRMLLGSMFVPAGIVGGAIGATAKGVNAWKIAQTVKAAQVAKTTKAAATTTKVAKTAKTAKGATASRMQQGLNKGNATVKPTAVVKPAVKPSALGPRARIAAGKPAVKPVVKPTVKKAAVARKPAVKKTKVRGN